MPRAAHAVLMGLVVISSHNAGAQTRGVNGKLPNRRRRRDAMRRCKRRSARMKRDCLLKSQYPAHRLNRVFTITTAQRGNTHHVHTDIHDRIT